MIHPDLTPKDMDAFLDICLQTENACTFSWSGKRMIQLDKYRSFPIQDLNLYFLKLGCYSMSSESETLDEIRRKLKMLYEHSEEARKKLCFYQFYVKFIECILREDVEF